MIQQLFSRRSHANPAQRDLIHPDWEAGHYVTYVFEPTDGRDPLGVGLKVIGRQEDGRWILQADFQQAHIHNTVLLADDPSPDPQIHWLMPFHESCVRGASDEPFDLPISHSTFVLNMMVYRKSRRAVEALLGKTQSSDLPCEIRQTWPLDHDNRLKTFDLAPSIPVSGVARVSFGPHPMTVSSFGRREPHETGYFEWVDFSHPTRVDYGAFSLVHPLTWFFHPETPESASEPVPEPADAPTATEQSMHARIGGHTCACALSVSIFEGDRAAIGRYVAGVHKTFDAAPSKQSSLTRVGETATPDGTGYVVLFSTEIPGIDGLARFALWVHPSGEKAVRILVHGCASRAHPQGRRLLQEMRSAFDVLLGSFRFEDLDHRR